MVDLALWSDESTTERLRDFRKSPITAVHYPASSASAVSCRCHHFILLLSLASFFYSAAVAAVATPQGRCGSLLSCYCNELLNPPLMNLSAKEQNWAGRQTVSCTQLLLLVWRTHFSGGHKFVVWAHFNGRSEPVNQSVNRWFRPTVTRHGLTSHKHSIKLSATVTSKAYQWKCSHLRKQ